MLVLGLLNISLGVFLIVSPLPLWVAWYIYLGFLVIIILGMEIVKLLRSPKKNKPSETKGKTKKTINKYLYK